MSYNNLWKCNDGTQISVKEMSIDHVKNTLKMLINKYSIECINMGARYASGINIDIMTEEEARAMLNKTCHNRKYLKIIVAEKCFGPTEWSCIKDLISI